MANKRILDKLIKKEYTDELEEILASKPYNEDVKNLLLDILYRLDDSYNDYQKVKPDSLTKDEYIINIINTVKNECDNISFIRPNKKDTKDYKINKEKKEIVCYPILTKMLYALSEIRKKEVIIKDEDELIIETLGDLIKTGNNINTVEPLRDFNGFSWNIVTNDIENLYYNLIYQDLIILVGNTFMEEWANNTKPQIDYVEQLKLLIKKMYGTKQSEDIIKLIRKLSILLEIDINTEIASKIYEEKIKIEKELEKYKSPEKYITKITERRKNLLKKIRDIDILLNNKKMLQSEYRKRNSLLEDKDKIFSVKVLSKQLQEERNRLLRRIESFNDLVNPMKLMERTQCLQRKLEYRKLIDIKNIKDEIFINIVLLQQAVIKCINTKIKKCNSKQSLIKIMYELRYFCLLPVYNGKNIDEMNELKKLLNKTKQEFAKKTNELKITNQVFESERLNIAIFSHIFSSSIISIEDLSLKITKVKDQWHIQFFDEGTIDKKYKIGLNLNSEDIKIKLNKIVKLFENHK